MNTYETYVMCLQTRVNSDTRTRSRIHTQTSARTHPPLSRRRRRYDIDGDDDHADDHALTKADHVGPINLDEHICTKFAVRIALMHEHPHTHTHRVMHRLAEKVNYALCVRGAPRRKKRTLPGMECVYIIKLRAALA